jgi:hypothetical protein
MPVELAGLKLLTTGDLAKAGIPEKTQANLRCLGRSPKYLKLSGKIYYLEEDVAKWALESRRASTSDPGGQAD